MTKIAPSILSADFSDMKSDVKSMNECGADLLHIDVMDGIFVPNLTFGMKMVSDIRKCSTLPFDVHLMIVDPSKYVEEFAKAGADYITFHIESDCDAKATLEKIKDLGVKCGIVISPDTEVSAIESVLHLCDMVLVMSVYPGFGGQKFMPNCIGKIEKLATLREANGYSYLIEVDGGINAETAKLTKEAGAAVLVAGNYVFSATDRKMAIESLK